MVNSVLAPTLTSCGLSWVLISGQPPSRIIAEIKVINDNVADQPVSLLSNQDFVRFRGLLETLG
jgi:hypothetical protein